MERFTIISKAINKIKKLFVKNIAIHEHDKLLQSPGVNNYERYSTEEYLKDSLNIGDSEEINESYANIKVKDDVIVCSEEQKKPTNVLTEEEREQRNQLRRINRRKKQVQDDMYKAISLIKAHSWRFSAAKRIDAPDYIWECTDSDGIKIVGKVNADGTNIKMIFPSQTIAIKNKFCVDLEEALADDYTLRDIRKWRTQKKETSLALRTLFADTPELALRQIATGQIRIPFRHFSSAVNGYEWVCKSGEGIKLFGEVTVLYTKIKIFVDEKEIYAASTNGKEIEKYLLPEKHLNEINKFRGNWSPSRAGYTYSAHSYYRKCLYCGKENSVGNICESCREKYQKTRRGVGGYPSYDPHAGGSNLLKADR